jgi:AcrR family transcriptional regulator
MKKSTKTVRSEDIPLQGNSKTRPATRIGKEARRKALLESAANLISREGLSAVTMHRLARESGMSNALIYHHFESREDILVSLLEGYWADSDREARQIREHQGLSADDQERLVCEAYIRSVARRGPAFLRLRYGASAEPEVEKRIYARRKRIVAFNASELRKHHPMSPKVARIAVSLLLAAIEEAARMHVVDGEDVGDVVAIYWNLREVLTRSGSGWLLSPSLDAAVESMTHHVGV